MRLITVVFTILTIFMAILLCNDVRLTKEQEDLAVTAVLVFPMLAALSALYITPEDIGGDKDDA